MSHDNEPEWDGDDVGESEITQILASRKNKKTKEFEYRVLWDDGDPEDPDYTSWEVKSKLVAEGYDDLIVEFKARKAEKAKEEEQRKEEEDAKKAQQLRSNREAELRLQRTQQGPVKKEVDLFANWHSSSVIDTGSDGQLSQVNKFVRFSQWIHAYEADSSCGSLRPVLQYLKSKSTRDWTLLDELMDPSNAQTLGFAVWKKVPALLRIPAEYDGRNSERPCLPVHLKLLSKDQYDKHLIEEQEKQNKLAAEEEERRAKGEEVEKESAAPSTTVITAPSREEDQVWEESTVPCVRHPMRFEKAPQHFTSTLEAFFLSQDRRLLKVLADVQWNVEEAWEEFTLGENAPAAKAAAAESQQRSEGEEEDDEGSNKRDQRSDAVIDKEQADAVNKMLAEEDALAEEEAEAFAMMNLAPNTFHESADILRKVMMFTEFTTFHSMCMVNKRFLAYGKTILKLRQVAYRAARGIWERCVVKSNLWPIAVAPDPSNFTPERFLNGYITLKSEEDPRDGGAPWPLFTGAADELDMHRKRRGKKSWRDLKVFHPDVVVQEPNAGRVFRLCVGKSLTQASNYSVSSSWGRGYSTTNFNTGNWTDRMCLEKLTYKRDSMIVPVALFKFVRISSLRMRNSIRNGLLNEVHPIFQGVNGVLTTRYDHKDYLPHQVIPKPTAEMAGQQIEQAEEIARWKKIETAQKRWAGFLHSLPAPLVLPREQGDPDAPFLMVPTNREILDWMKEEVSLNSVFSAAVKHGGVPLPPSSSAITSTSTTTAGGGSGSLTIGGSSSERAQAQQPAGRAQRLKLVQTQLKMLRFLLTDAEATAMKLDSVWNEFFRM